MATSNPSTAEATLDKVFAWKLDRCAAGTKGALAAILALAGALLSELIAEPATPASPAALWIVGVWIAGLAGFAAAMQVTAKRLLDEYVLAIEIVGILKVVYAR